MTAIEGHLVATRYRLRRRIGTGGMGVVWQAHDERLDRVVAVKQLVLPAGMSEDEAEAARQRVLREARIAARLHHPHAVGVYDVVTDDGQPMLIMEYVSSRSLAVVLAERAPLAPAEVARIGAPVASALAAAHAAGIVHRDVKPGNILLGDDGTIKISDFGIARATGDVTVTRTGLLAGTPAFLSPEAARGEQPAPASDVFSLGATLYTAVEGTPPFGDSDNPIALLHAVAAGHVTPPRQAGPLTAVLMRMLHADPRARPAMAQIQEDLTGIAGPALDGAVSRPAPTRLDLHPADATPAGDVGPVGAPRRSRRATTYAVLGVLAAGLVALLAAALITSPGPRDATTGSTPPATPPDPARLEQAVRDYYALLPDQPDQA